ncbi:hypothetical protein [Streptomyces sp. 11x1]|uniref:hypothetical protein n=1 Tax=Streptomyces sp. 11x1 TaxID=3038642 RepID=UPI002931EB0D|nr:hypothetical protein [Streptomyces sp. 11x1]WNZ11573.1 hypothetical protein P8T65_31130 [Streptomyces sp. 11x1]
MTIRIATFNAENLFRRPTVFGLDDERRKEILDDFTESAGRLDKKIHQEADKERIAALIVKHGAHDLDPGSRRPFFVNQPRGGAKLCTVSTLLAGQGAWSFRSGVNARSHVAGQGRPNRRRGDSASREGSRWWWRVEGPVVGGCSGRRERAGHSQA